ncbi:MAG: hypothetical protein HDR88_11300 [Bacteroides sp.]|nr:hypothetical protein [Bacteroides sp.]
MSLKTYIGGMTLEKRRKMVESTATFGLLLVCIALVSPFVGFGNMKILSIFKWLYSAGALIYTVARVVDVNDPSDSMRLRRLRRLEFWAGVAFIMAAAFWFYEERHLGPYAGPLAVMRNTIMFTLAGAAIQVIASWMIVAHTKKEQGK